EAERGPARGRADRLRRRRRHDRPRQRPGPGRPGARTGRLPGGGLLLRSCRYLRAPLPCHGDRAHGERDGTGDGVHHPPAADDAARGPAVAAPHARRGGDRRRAGPGAAVHGARLHPVLSHPRDRRCDQCPARHLPDPGERDPARHRLPRRDAAGATPCGHGADRSWAGGDRRTVLAGAARRRARSRGTPEGVPQGRREVRPQVPITPPSSLRTRIVAERGRDADAPSGQVENSVGCRAIWFSVTVAPSIIGVLGWPPISPGCCTFTNIAVPSGLNASPVISQADGPTRKRRSSPVRTSATSIWLLPCPSYSPASV